MSKNKNESLNAQQPDDESSDSEHHEPGIEILTPDMIEEDERKCQERTEELLNRISSARIRLLARVPFFGNLCLKLRPRIARKLDNVATAGVAPDGTLIINYDFIKDLTDKQFRGLLCHEVMHPALQFWERKSTRSLLKFNIAHDHAINLIIDAFQSDEIELPPNALKDSKYIDWMAEVIYADLGEDKIKEMIEGAYGSATCPTCDGTGQNQGGKGSGADEGQCPTCEGSGNNNAIGDCREDLSSTTDGKNAAKGDSGAKRRLERDWKISIVSAAQEHEQVLGQGSMPSSVKRLIDELVEPKINWREALSRFIGEHGKRQDYSYRKPSRRSESVGEYLPIFVPNGADVVALLDTSGSMSADRLKEGAGEIQGICEDLGVTVRLMICDAALHRDVEIEDGLEVLDNAVGGGGSDFRPAFDKLEDDGFEGVVVAVTDGMISVPKTKPPHMKDVVWLIHNNEKPPTDRYGEVIKFD